MAIRGAYQIAIGADGQRWSAVFALISADGQRENTADQRY